ncbi:MAG: transglycosylase domain-containing protein [Bdellovibrionales bacterium]|nr:transglycosylase domain-containing protein [Bdellovibrionales bacterium]
MANLRKLTFFSVFSTISCLIVLATYIYSKAPVDHLKSKIFYRANSLNKARVIGLQSSNHLTIKKISPYLLIATIAVEDQKFYKHIGIDFKEIQTSLLDYLFKGRKLRGASTISQQLMKSIFFPKTKSFFRKFNEAIYTLKLERNFTKNEILELYLNCVHWGNRVYGIQEAASKYINSSVDKLSIEDAVLLISLLPNPIQREKSLQIRVISNELKRALINNLYKTHYVLDYYQDKDILLSQKFDLISFTPMDQIFSYRVKQREIKTRVKEKVEKSFNSIIKKFFTAKTI